MRLTWSCGTVVFVVAVLCAPAVAADDTLTATTPWRPGATIEDACKAAGLKVLLGGDLHHDDVACRVKKLKPKVKVGKPYRKLGLVERISSSHGEAMLGIQTDAGWYLAPLGYWPTKGDRTGGIKIAAIKVKDVIPGGAKEILVTGTQTEQWDNADAVWDMLWVCGVGKTGVPGCVAIDLGVAWTPTGDNDVPKWKIKLSYAFDELGALTRKARGKWPKDARWHATEALDPKAFVNTRWIAFPEPPWSFADGPRLFGRLSVAAYSGTPGDVTQENPRGVNCQGVVGRACLAWIGIPDEAALSQMEDFETDEQAQKFDTCEASAEAKHFLRWCNVSECADPAFSTCVWDGWGDDAWDACARKCGY